MDIAKLAIEVDASQATAAAKQLQTLQGAAAKTDTAVQKSNGSFKMAGNGLQMMGYQVQDIAVQLGMGTSPFIVLSQQGSQIASIFGPGGAVIGALLAVSGAIAGPLVASMMGASTSTDDLIDDVARLAGQFDEAADGSYKLSEELVRIARVSQEAARLRLRIDTEQAKESLEGVRSAMADTLAEGLEVGSFIIDFAGIIERGGLSDALGPDLRRFRATTKLTYEELNNLGSAADAARGSLDPKAYSQLALVVDNLKEKYGESNKTVNILSSGLAEQIPLAIEAAQTVNRLTDATDNFDSVLQRTNETMAEGMDFGPSSADYYAEQLRLLKEANAEQLRADDARLASRASALKAIEAIEVQQMSQQERLTDNYLTQQSQISAALAGEFESIESSLMAGVIATQTAEEMKLAAVEEANALKLASDSQYYIASYQLALQDAQQRAALNATIVSSAQSLNGNLIAALEAYGQESSDLGLAAIAVQKGLMVAQAIMGANMAAIQTQVAYAGLAAATLNPALIEVGAARAEIVRGMGYASAALIAATEFAPARALGGQVTAGTTYLVGERGPELVTMGANGYVTANDKLQGSNQTVVLQVSTGVSQTVRAEMASMMPGIVKMIGQATQGARR